MREACIGQRVRGHMPVLVHMEGRENSICLLCKRA